MNDDFLLDWQNIEYALNESELIMLSEFNANRRGVFSLGAPGKAVMIPAAAMYKGTTTAAKAVAKSTVNGWKDISQNGFKDNFGIVRGTKRLMKSPLMGTGFWQRLKNKLKEIWLKFKNILASMFRTNQGFVNKELLNAEATIRNAMAQDAANNYNKKTGEINSSLQTILFNNVYQYWKTDRLLDSVRIPPLNIKNQNMMDALSDTSLFASQFVKGLQGTNCEAEQLKAYFRGGEPVNITLYELTPYIKILVKHCSGRDEVLNQLKQDENNLLRAADEAERMVLQTTGLNNEAVDSMQFDNNVNDIKIQQTSDTVIKIRNYISICKCICGAKESIVVERYKQALQILRVALRKCAPATKEQVQNIEVENNTKVTKESSKEQEPQNEYSNSFFGKMKNRRDTLKKIMDPAKERGEIEVDPEYLNSLPSDEKKLNKRIEKVFNQKEEIINFIKLKKINQTDPRFQPLWDQVLDFDKQLAVLNKRLKDVQNSNE